MQFYVEFGKWSKWSAPNVKHGQIMASDHTVIKLGINLISFNRKIRLDLKKVAICASQRIPNFRLFS